MSDGRRRRIEEWVERERKKRDEEGGEVGKAGGWERCIVETHITRKTLRVTWRTVGNGSRRRKRVSPEEDEGLARRSCLLDLHKESLVPFSLSLSLSVSRAWDKEGISFRRIKPPLLGKHLGLAMGCNNYRGS